MRLTGRARKAGVMGWPVEHSRSPALHGWWIGTYGLDAAYLPLPVRPEQVETALRALPVLGFAGCNLTMPHKELALRIVDEVDPVARRIGAVNTVVVGADGRLAGTNTDAFGFIASLRDAQSAWRPDAAPVVVLGAGGAARAIAVALIEAGVRELRIANRTEARAQRLADELGLRVVPWARREEALAGAGLLVNTTSLGMAGHEPLELRLDDLPRTALVDDIVYVPLETPLLAAARRRGHPVADGLGMLLHQARPGFRAWFGVDPEVTPALRDAVLQTF